MAKKKQNHQVRWLKTVKQDMIIILKIPLKQVLRFKVQKLNRFDGSANLKDSYAQVKRGEMYINNMHIAPYEEGNRFNHDPLRSKAVIA